MDQKEIRPLITPEEAKRMGYAIRQLGEAIQKAATQIGESMGSVFKLLAVIDGYTPIEETKYKIRHIGIMKGGWKRNDHYRISRNR